jgi:hypothetical protein
VPGWQGTTRRIPEGLLQHRWGRTPHQRHAAGAARELRRKHGASDTRCGPCLGRVGAHAHARAWRKPGCTPAGDRSADCHALSKALHRIECAFTAYNALREHDPGALSPHTEVRLQALLVDRAMPLLLRCLQMRKGGARRTMHTACDACLAASLLALMRGLPEQAGCRPAGALAARTLHALWLDVPRVAASCCCSWSPQSRSRSRVLALGDGLATCHAQAQGFCRAG